MDPHTTLFSFDQIEDFLQFSPPPFHQDNQPIDDHLEIPFLQNTSPSKPLVAAKNQKSSVSSDNIVDNSTKNHKKMAHKDIEKQRRQEMSKLHRSLRMLLPIERLKGKRSMADHVHETAGYIRELQMRIEKLSETRDQLKQLKNHSSCPASIIDLPVRSRTWVAVEMSYSGLAVVVNTSLIGGVKLSRVLNILIEQGLVITHCISNKVDARLLHKIETEVNEGRTIDSTVVQQKLTDYCNTN